MTRFSLKGRPTCIRCPYRRGKWRGQGLQPESESLQDDVITLPLTGPCHFLYSVTKTSVRPIKLSSQSVHLVKIGHDKWEGLPPSATRQLDKPQEVMTPGTSSAGHGKSQMNTDNNCMRCKVSSGIILLIIGVVCAVIALPDPVQDFEWDSLIPG